MNMAQSYEFNIKNIRTSVLHITFLYVTLRECYLTIEVHRFRAVEEKVLRRIYGLRSNSRIAKIT
jgi:hypothetical protein